MNMEVNTLGHVIYKQVALASWLASQHNNIYILWKYSTFIWYITWMLPQTTCNTNYVPAECGRCVFPVFYLFIIGQCGTFMFIAIILFNSIVWQFKRILFYSKIGCPWLYKKSLKRLKAIFWVAHAVALAKWYFCHRFWCTWAVW